MPPLIAAGLWGLLAGSALVIGALAGYYARIPQRVIAGIMAFGAGVLISALSYDLVEEAFHQGGLKPVLVGFLGGASVYTLATWLLSHFGARHRKRSGTQQPSEEEHEGSGLAIALGALLDGIPESIVIGVGMIGGGAVGWVTVTAIFLSNLPEGLSSAAGMRRNGRSPLYVFTVWSVIAALSGLAAMAGYGLFSHYSAAVIAGTTSVAAGAILAMLADTMIPEAFAEAHNFSGLITVLGFLTAFALSSLD